MKVVRFYQFDVNVMGLKSVGVSVPSLHFPSDTDGFPIEYRNISTLHASLFGLETGFSEPPVPRCTHLVKVFYKIFPVLYFLFNRRPANGGISAAVSVSSLRAPAARLKCRLLPTQSLFSSIIQAPSFRF